MGCSGKLTLAIALSGCAGGNVDRPLEPSRDRSALTARPGDVSPDQIPVPGQLALGRTSRRPVPALARDGYDVSYQEFDGPHTVPGTIIQEAVDWLR